MHSKRSRTSRRRLIAIVVSSETVSAELLSIKALIETLVQALIETSSHTLVHALIEALIGHLPHHTGVLQVVLT